MHVHFVGHCRIGTLLPLHSHEHAADGALGMPGCVWNAVQDQAGAEPHA